MSESLRRLTEAGVAVWLDDLSRHRLATGNLTALTKDRQVVGVTSNPTIFQKAIGGGDAYDEQVHDLATRRLTVEEALRMITTYDVRWACDLLRPVFDATEGVDGRVSIEVDPRLAHDPESTVAEARQLWWLVDRPNLFIKIPATRAGVPAITRCLAEGISVNVTLIFSLERYSEVMRAFLDGIAAARQAGRDLGPIGSVASFFVSRVDTEVDKRLDKIGTEEARALRGQAGIANARLAYQRYQQIFDRQSSDRQSSGPESSDRQSSDRQSSDSQRWESLRAAGARPQRPLWASTGVKDPAYEDTRYVVELVAAETVNTMPEETLEAVADHGAVRGDTVTATYTEARRVLDALADVGVDYEEVVATLEAEGVEKFETSWTELLLSLQGELERKVKDTQ